MELLLQLSEKFWYGAIVQLVFLGQWGFRPSRQWLFVPHFFFFFLEYEVAFRRKATIQKGMFFFFFLFSCVYSNNEAKGMIEYRTLLLRWTSSCHPWMSRIHRPSDGQQSKGGRLGNTSLVLLFLAQIVYICPCVCIQIKEKEEQIKASHHFLPLVL
jgi:hypothetical protein